MIFLTTEAVPFAKTGGLADVCGALPIELASRGHRPLVLMPAFPQIHLAGVPIETTDISFAVPINDKIVGGRLLRSKLPGSEVPVYFIDQPQYYGRPALYGDAAGDYGDNCERFAFFCRAALQAITRLGCGADILHCNDWQTGLVPAYVRTEFERHPWMRKAATVLTVHNLAYQGHFWHWDMQLTGLPWEYFNPGGMEFYGHLNLLKTGLVFADSLSTVSPQYAKEIQTPEHGCGLDGVLRDRAADLVGIINGVDQSIWDPRTDPHLVKTYDEQTYMEGKSANRTALRAEFDLPDESRVPLIGLIGRLADQKGWDLVIEAMRDELERDSPMQWVVLGTGDPRYHKSLQELADEYPNRLGLRLGFSNSLAHLIEAAADMFLMPSRYEPCGLNQLYSLRYGTVPVVNPTGGLADTVVDTTAETLAAGAATGFHMREYSVDALVAALWRGALIYWDDPQNWARIVQTGMRQDWSWRKSAAEYERLYSKTRLRKEQRVASPPPRPPIDRRA